MKRSRTIRNTLDSLSDYHHEQHQICCQDMKQDNEWSLLCDVDAISLKDTRPRSSTTTTVESSASSRSRNSDYSYEVEDVYDSLDDQSIGLSIEDEGSPIIKSRKMSHDVDNMFSFPWAPNSKFEFGTSTSCANKSQLHMTNLLTSNRATVLLGKTDELNHLTSHFMTLICTKVPNPTGQVTIL